MKSTSILAFAVAMADYASAHTTYHGHQVWHLGDLMRSEEVVEVVRRVKDDLGLQVWGHGGSWVDLHVPPSSQVDLSLALASLNLQHAVLIHDLQSAIEEQRAEVARRSAAATQTSRIGLDTFHTYEEILQYQDDLTAIYDWVSRHSIGTTVEGRDLVVSILAAPGNTTTVKPSVWLDCGIHAKEWISPAVCVYGLDLLTTGYGVDPNVTDLLDRYDFHVLPVHNPDGYVYTWTDDRLWRKNRMLYAGATCHGIDLNRNFDDGHWGGAGSSDSSCSENYRGPVAFSEAETRSVRDYVRSLKGDEVAAFFSLHSYGQMWLFAYGWSGDDNPNADENYRVAEIGVAALEGVYNTAYEVGSIYDIFYPAAGTSVDWSVSEGVVHSYTLELRDTGNYGVLLPPSEILPTSEETWAGLIEALLAM